jgi:hypothetical protein
MIDPARETRINGVSLETITKVIDLLDDAGVGVAMLPMNVSAGDDTIEERLARRSRAQSNLGEARQGLVALYRILEQQKEDMG